MASIGGLGSLTPATDISREHHFVQTPRNISIAPPHCNCTMCHGGKDTPLEFGVISTPQGSGLTLGIEVPSITAADPDMAWWDVLRFLYLQSAI